MTTVRTIAGDFNKARYDRLAKAYQAATKKGTPAFAFEGETVITQFAKYLLEYLEPTFKNMQ